jgi:hypothetical protein
MEGGMFIVLLFTGEHSGAKENIRLFIYGERSRIEREIKA